MTVETLTFAQAAVRYCDRQESTPFQLKERLLAQKQEVQPDGWMLLECQDMSSSSMGSLTLFPYGPNNTFKTPATRPFSPRGLASDMSVVVAILPAQELTPETPLPEWNPPASTRSCEKYGPPRPKGYRKPRK